MKNKWNGWHDSLPKHTQEYLKTATIWTDLDLAKFAFIAFVSGVLVGLVF